MIIHSQIRVFMQLALPHTDRIAAILADIRPVFARKGFDSASMQDLAQAANMSAGNFYRYFASKEAIIEAMIASDLSDITRDFQMIKNAPAPLALLRQVLVARAHMHRDNCDGAIWAEMNATAQRRPVVAAAIAQMEETIIGFLVEIFCRDLGYKPEDAPRSFQQTAALVVLLFKAPTMLGASEHTRSDEMNRQILRIIDNALSDLNTAQNSRF